MSSGIYVRNPEAVARRNSAAGGEKVFITRKPTPFLLPLWRNRLGASGVPSIAQQIAVAARSAMILMPADQRFTASQASPRSWDEPAQEAIPSVSRFSSAR